MKFGKAKADAFGCGDSGKDNSSLDEDDQCFPIMWQEWLFSFVMVCSY